MLVHVHCSQKVNPVAFAHNIYRPTHERIFLPVEVLQICNCDLLPPIATTCRRQCLQLTKDSWRQCGGDKEPVLKVGSQE